MPTTCRYLFISLALVLSSFRTQGQENVLNRLANQKPQKIQKLDTSDAMAYRLWVETGFDQHRVTLKGLPPWLVGKAIQEVQLYYTHYRQSDSFNQVALNKQRIEALSKALPGLLEQEGVRWKLMEQMGAKTATDAKKYPHGFLITFRDETYVSRREENLFLDSLGHALKILKDTILSINCIEKVKKKKEKTGQYLPLLAKKRAAGIRKESEGWLFKRKPEFEIIRMVSYSCDTIKGPHPDAPKWFENIARDTTVSTILNQFPYLKQNAVVAVDVTGSMSPYMADFAIWSRFQQHQKPFLGYLFFNDGDSTPDIKKKTGQVGGIYVTKQPEFSAIDSTMSIARKAGNGGDAQENDVEALLMAQKHFASASHLVLIADNYSPIRDLNLVYKLKKPVHIILCGSSLGLINPEYLDLARKTNGHVHLMDLQLQQLSRMNEGATFTYNGFQYKIIKGQFKILKPEVVEK